MSARSSRIELRIPETLKDWVAEYARARNTTVSGIVIRFLTRLKEEESKKNTDAEQV